MMEPLHPSDTTSTNHQQDAFLAELFGTTQSSSTKYSPPTTANAPVLGLHRQTHSLVGFDPLISSDKKESQRAVASQNFEKQILDIPVGPPILESYTPPTRNSKLPPTTKRGHRKTQSLSGRLAIVPDSKMTDHNKSVLSPVNQATIDLQQLSPPRPDNRQGNIFEAHVGDTTPKGNRLRSPWARKTHRKTNSLSISSGAGTSPFSRFQKQSYSTSSSPMGALDAKNEILTEANQMKLMSPMIKDLFLLDQEAAKETQPSLFIPSLAKPRPTSFLTGQEVVARSSEQDPSPWQLEIPSYSDALICARLCQFLETYRTEELLDLRQLVGITRMKLVSFASGNTNLQILNSSTEIAEYHRATVESLLECGNDIMEVKGFFTAHSLQHIDDGNPDHRREVLIVERQNKFLCIFRGTTPEQQGKFARQPETCEMTAGPKSQVYIDRYAAFGQLQGEVFQLLDKLAEDNPFCDIAFSGHSFGAAMATLAAQHFAVTRTSLRVSCLVSAAPKCGLDDFRWAVHSTPNLNCCRMLVDRRAGGGVCVGHSLRLIPAANKEKPTVELLKFDAGHGTPHFRSLLHTATKPKEKDVHEYVLLLEALDADSWVKDYYNEDGAGVRGKDNEARQLA